MSTKIDITLVNTYNKDTLGVADLSLYQVSPTNPSLEITPPGFNKVSLVFTPSSINTYGANHLLIGNEGDPLPDGIYTLKYSVSPNTINFVEKSFIRTDKIECQYDKLLLAIDNGCTCDLAIIPRLKWELRNVKLLIEGAIAATNLCDIKAAYNMYSKAVVQIKKISLCNCKQ